MKRPPNAQLTHVGLYVRDMPAMVDFYGGLLGLVVTDSGPFRDGSITFLSRKHDEHHQVVLVTGRAASMDKSPVSQISFRVDSLEDLQYFNGAVAARGVAQVAATNHGNAWSIYFLDPEGNRIEIYAPSPWYVHQPCQHPLDLGRPADTIRRETEALVGADPTMQPAAAWSAALAERLAP